MAELIKTKIWPQIDLILLDTITIFQNLAKPNSFWDICEKLLSDPYVLFLVMVNMFFQQIKNPNLSSMQDTRRNIHTGSNWSSSVIGEEFWKIVNDDDHETPNDGNSTRNKKVTERIKVQKVYYSSHIICNTIVYMKIWHFKQWVIIHLTIF